MKTLLHSRTRAQLEGIQAGSGRSYIFHGQPSVGKATAAAELARRLNCQCEAAGEGLCSPCRQFEAGNYPDLVQVGLEDRATIGIEQIRTLVQSLSLSPYYQGGARVVVIDDAHLMTIEAQNALLKLIEEPPAQTIFILVAGHPESLIVTVRSRCQPVFFARPPQAEVAALVERQCGLRPSDAAAVAAAAEGVPGLAINLAASPTEAESRLELVRLAKSLPGMSRFERLLAAGRLTTAKADLWRLSAALQSDITGRLLANPAEASPAASSLQALEQFRRQLSAKVSPRAALERLMLEL